MVKSIIISKHGGPEVLEFKDVKVGSPGPEEIKIKNLAIGLNFIDTYHRSGLYKLNLPSGIGMEGAGIVQEVGSSVKNFNKGDRVTYSQMPLGSYSNERIIPEKIAVKIPDGISDKVAASIMTKGLTSHYLLFKTYKAKAGELILFHAAAGGVGQVFCQWAKSIGCRIEITGNKGVGVVYDGVGKKTFEKSINCLKPMGTMISFGNASGALDPIDVKKYIAHKSLFFTRPGLAHYGAGKAALEEGASALFEQIKFGRIKINIFKEYKLSEAKKAHEDLEGRKILGPAVLIPN